MSTPRRFGRGSPQVQQQQAEMEPHHGGRARPGASRFAHQRRETRLEFPETDGQSLARGERYAVEKRPQRRQQGIVAQRPPNQVLRDRAREAFTAGLQPEDASGTARQPQERGRAEVEGRGMRLGEGRGSLGHEERVHGRVSVGRHDRPHSRGQPRAHHGGHHGRPRRMVPFRFLHPKTFRVDDHWTHSIPVRHG